MMACQLHSHGLLDASKPGPHRVVKEVGEATPAAHTLIVLRSSRQGNDNLILQAILSFHLCPKATARHRDSY